jgi:hypothetical protein
LGIRPPDNREVMKYAAPNSARFKQISDAIVICVNPPIQLRLQYYVNRAERIPLAAKLSASEQKKCPAKAGQEGDIDFAWWQTTQRRSPLSLIRADRITGFRLGKENPR